MPLCRPARSPVYHHAHDGTGMSADRTAQERYRVAERPVCSNAKRCTCCHSSKRCRGVPPADQVHHGGQVITSFRGLNDTNWLDLSWRRGGAMRGGAMKHGVRFEKVVLMVFFVACSSRWQGLKLHSMPDLHKITQLFLN
jgi:hypothetical protein